jgi:hypothetical protein
VLAVVDKSAGICGSHTDHAMPESHRPHPHSTPISSPHPFNEVYLNPPASDLQGFSFFSFFQIIFSFIIIILHSDLFQQ